MKKIRFGKDITFSWAITTNGEPMPLEGRDLSVEVAGPTGRKQTLDHEAEGNVLTFRYRGIDHKMLGVHRLTLWENKGKEGQSACDITQAFELVSSTDKEN